MQFKFVAVPDGDDVLGIKQGDTLTATLVASPETTDVGIQYMYMQLAAKAKKTWVLVGCKSAHAGAAGQCDFKRAFAASSAEQQQVLQVKRTLRGRTLDLY